MHEGKDCLIWEGRQQAMQAFLDRKTDYKTMSAIDAARCANARLILAGIFR